MVAVGNILDIVNSTCDIFPGLSREPINRCCDTRLDVEIRDTTGLRTLSEVFAADIVAALSHLRRLVFKTSKVSLLYRAISQMFVARTN